VVFAVTASPFRAENGVVFTRCQRQLKIPTLPAVASSDDRKVCGSEDLVWSLPSRPLSGTAVELVEFGLDLIRVVD